MKGGLRDQGVVKVSKENEPLVSVITVVRNGERNIKKAIESVKAQTYKNIEYIIIDGNSTDGTVRILKENEGHIDLWISEPDEGIYFAMNKGIGLAKGEIIGILNSDDRYRTDAVEHVVEAMKSNPSGIYHGDMLVIEKSISTRVRPDINLMNERPSIYHPTCFVMKKVYNEVGLFDTQFRISSDYEFLLRCIRKGVTFHYIPEVLTEFTPGGISASCYTNIEGYKIMKMHKTGHHRIVIWWAVKCYLKNFVKKILFLK